MPGIKVSAFLPAVRRHVGDGYVYGAVGQTCTPALLKLKERQYGRSLGNGYYQLDGDYTKGKCARWLGRWVADCSGLIKAVRRDMGGPYRDVSAQGTYAQCDETGPIATMPFIPGTALFVWSDGMRRMCHVGVYAGGGRVIQSAGVLSGVIEGRYGRGWTHWGRLDWLDYDVPADAGLAPDPGADAHAGDAANPKPDDPFDAANPPVLARGSRGDAVKILQGKLNLAGAHLEEDGVFGPLTLLAVRAYQKKNALLADGIVGPRTWGALLK